MKKKLLICGGGGFIGQNVVDYFSGKDDYEVTATYFRKNPKNYANAIWEKVDLTDQQSVDKIVRGKDIVIQMAAVTSGVRDIIERPYIHVTDNAVMNSLLLKSAFTHSVSHFIFPSCTVMYTSRDVPLKESDFNRGEMHKNYFGVGSTKVYIEDMCRFFSELGRTKHTVLRHSNVYGPHDKFDLERSHVFGATINKVMTATDGKINIWGNGEEKRDLLYVGDLIEMIDKVIKVQEANYQIYNVGSGEGTSVNGLVKKIIEASGKKLEIIHDPSRPTINTNISLDSSRAWQELGWCPKTSLDQGIKMTLDWYKENVV